MKSSILFFKKAKSIIACGSDLKGSFAFSKGRRAFLSDNFGDLRELRNFLFYSRKLESWRQTENFVPDIIACDLHSGYRSSHHAEELNEIFKNAALIRVQHHEAHVASVMADNLVRSGIIGIAFDGTGLGADGNIWGGEFFVGTPKIFKRVAHLKYIPLPGMDMAVSEPWRMAASFLYSAFGEDFLKLKIGFVKELDKTKWGVLKKMIDGKINSPLASSAGRLFDGASSIILNRKNASYEAELPIALEEIVDRSCDDFYDFAIKKDDGMIIVDTPDIIKGVAQDAVKKVNPSIVAAKFHNTLAEVAVKVAVKLREKYDINKVGLSGGVFQNKFLTNAIRSKLGKNGFIVYVHSRTLPNDSSIPLGQIMIANARAKCA